jgi:hypothetical protein
MDERNIFVNSNLAFVMYWNLLLDNKNYIILCFFWHYYVLILYLVILCEVPDLESEFYLFYLFNTHQQYLNTVYKIGF